jgi:hypothetical protein
VSAFLHRQLFLQPPPSFSHPSHLSSLSSDFRFAAASFVCAMAAVALASVSASAVALASVSASASSDNKDVKNREKSPEPKKKKSARSRSRSRNPARQSRKRSPSRDENGNTEQENLLSWLIENLPGRAVIGYRGSAAECFYHSMRKRTFEELSRLASSESQTKYPGRLKTVLERASYPVSMTKDERKTLGVSVDEMERLSSRY